MNSNLQAELFILADEDYKKFHSKLMPNISPDKIIGIRTPILRKFAKEFYKNSDIDAFLDSLPHEYYEENNLHAMLIEQIKDYDTAVQRTEEFLPYIDNWATCDIFSPPVFKKHPAELYEKIKIWLRSEHTYTKRFGITKLMSLYLDENFKEEQLSLVSEIRSDEYYVNMAGAWYFATALAKQYEASLPYLVNRQLDEWVHNKTIQKAVESYRISSEQKEYLKTLKIK